MNWLRKNGELFAIANKDIAALIKAEADGLDPNPADFTTPTGCKDGSFFEFTGMNFEERQAHAQSIAGQWERERLAAEEAKRLKKEAEKAEKEAQKKAAQEAKKEKEASDGEAKKEARPENKITSTFDIDIMSKEEADSSINSIFEELELGATGTN